MEKLVLRATFYSFILFILFRQKYVWEFGEVSEGLERLVRHCVPVQDRSRISIIIHLN